jgi:hypothetical protein
VSFLVAATVAFWMRFPKLERPAETGKPSIWGDVRAGFRWMLRRKPFLWLTANGSLVNFAFAPLMLLLPLLVRDRLAADRAAHGLSFEAALALVNTIGGLGGVIGGVLVSIFGFRNLRKVPLMIALLVGMGLGQLWVGFSTTLVLLSCGMFFTELMIAPLNTASFTLWQSLTPPHMLARAMSVRRFLAQSAIPARHGARGMDRRRRRAVDRGRVRGGAAGDGLPGAVPDEGLRDARGPDAARSRTPGLVSRARRRDRRRSRAPRPQAA